MDTQLADLEDTPSTITLLRYDDGRIRLDFGIGDVGVVMDHYQFKAMVLEMVRIARAEGWM